MAAGVPAQALLILAVQLLGGCGDPVAPSIAEVLEKTLGSAGRRLETSRIHLLDEGAGTTWRISVDLPHRLRADMPEGGYQVITVDDAFGVRLGIVRDLSGDELRSLKRVRDLLWALVLGPLHEAVDPRAIDGETWTFADAGGRRWTLEVAAQTGLPRSLAGPSGKVVFKSWLPKGGGASHLPTGAVLGDFGARGIRFEDGRLRLSDSYYQRPKKQGARKGHTIGGENRPRTPMLMPEPGHSWLCFEDPGHWPGRAALYKAGIAALEQAHHDPKGFATYWTANDRNILALPFARRSGPSQLQSPPGAWIEEPESGQMLLLYPPLGALEGAHARARTLLEAAMSSRDVTARGPLRWAPYLYLDEKIPGPDDLEELEVRFEWPVR